jgi:hypothetical protein
MKSVQRATQNREKVEEEIPREVLDNFFQWVNIMLKGEQRRGGGGDGTIIGLPLRSFEDYRYRYM